MKVGLRRERFAEPMLWVQFIVGVIVIGIGAAKFGWLMAIFATAVLGLAWITNVLEVHE